MIITLKKADFSASNIGTTVSETWLALPTTRYALGVTSSGTGRVSSNNAKRFSTADDTKANGILIPAGKTITIRGLASGDYVLRVDYIYGTSAGPNPAQGSTEDIEGLVGTASNFDSSNYFPLNKTEAVDTLSVTNSFGADYYFFFGFAGPTLAETINTDESYASYTLEYLIS